jgi:O-antigen ligase
MGKASRSQHKKLMLSVGGIVVLLFLSLTLGGDRLAQRHGFDDFDAFLYNRVLLKDSTVEVGTTGIFINVRDSGRFEMWQDSIERTLDSPWLGIGIGSRPLDVIGANTHNVAIFMLGSMGIPLFTLYCIQLVRLFRLVLLRLPNDRRYHFAFWGWLGYVVLGFSVGASFDQAFNVLFASLPFGFFATATDSVYLKAPVGPRRIRGRTRSRNVPPAGRHNYRPQGRARVS